MEGIAQCIRGLRPVLCSVELLCLHQIVTKFDTGEVLAEHNVVDQVEEKHVDVPAYIDEFLLVHGFVESDEESQPEGSPCPGCASGRRQQQAASVFHCTCVGLSHRDCCRACP